MTQPVLHYIYDPLCGWCYAAGPLIEAAANAGVLISLHGGGLFGSPTRVDTAKRNYMRQSDGHIAATRNLMARAGVHGFPGFLLERNGRQARVEHASFYSHPADFVNAIATLDQAST